MNDADIMAALRRDLAEARAEVLRLQRVIDALKAEQGAPRWIVQRRSTPAGREAFYVVHSATGEPAARKSGQPAFFYDERKAREAARLMSLE